MSYRSCLNRQLASLVSRSSITCMIALAVACGGTNADPVVTDAGVTFCTPSDDCREDCSCQSEEYCSADGACAVRLKAGSECTDGDQCERGACGPNLSGDTMVCQAAPGDRCTVDTCPYCEAMVNGVGWCPSLCENGGDCILGFDASRERDRSLGDNPADSVCVSSRIFSNQRVCRFDWGFGCIGSSGGELCAEGYVCNSRDLSNWNSLCESERVELGGRCQADGVCESTICGPDARCQAGAVGDVCDDDGDCDQLLCSPEGRCQGGDVGDPCDDGGDCASNVCGPSDTCSSGEEGVPCQTNSNCASPLICASTSMCAPVCSGSATACFEFDDDSDTCESTLGCGVGACRNQANACPSTLDRFECEQYQWCEHVGAIYCQRRSCNHVPRSDCGTTGGPFFFCGWEADLCGGTATPCQELSLAECSEQPGCEPTPAP